MVSIKTILSLGVAGATIAGAAAMWFNRDKIGGAFTRGVETHLTNPLGSWLDSLFASSPGGGNGGSTTSAPSPITNALGWTNPLPPAYAPTSTEPNILTPTQVTQYQDYAPAAKAGAEAVYPIWDPVSREVILKSIQETVAKHVQSGAIDPALAKQTEDFAFVDYTRESVGGTNPQFYELRRLDRSIFAPGPIPLSREAVQYYASQGIIAHAVYL